MKKQLTALIAAALMTFGVCAFAAPATLAEAKTPEQLEQTNEPLLTESEDGSIIAHPVSPAAANRPEAEEPENTAEPEPGETESAEAAEKAMTDAADETLTADASGAPDTGHAVADASGDEPVFTTGDVPGITAPSEGTDPNNIASSVDLVIDMEEHPLVVDSFAVVELYSPEDVLLASASEWVGGITERIVLHFDTPEYVLGQTFKVKLVSGLNWLQYYDTQYHPGSVFYIDTYGYYDENGSHVTGNDFLMTGDPLFTRDVVVYNEYGMMDLSPKARLIDGVTYVPVRQVAESLGLNVRYDGRYNSVAVSIGNKEVAYNINSPITNYFGRDEMMNGTTRSIGGYVFVPVRSLAEAFETGIEVLDFIDHFDVILGESQVVDDYYDSFYVNRMGIGSKTNYLVWVSKSEYKVRAYKGQQYKWEPIGEFPCAIGAPGTPTITGQFDYISRESAWHYGTYYVGPIMRFYNGYALHSTLLYYGGGEYDGRVGVQISHGCVRLHPQDINWLVDNIPLYSRIWVTE